ncbi:hypothetical protein DFH08DRAFT_950726 [Mycena albidolilacea]|uniref:Uncharacterized protein n=1 Tax=Mycena albidolilacea TaxID=1033008 RepID=A0AAD7F2H3_9AGAR|nr:hypothetical protein DFH08DRAFT_950726 [Mycena albidolilacea]
MATKFSTLQNNYKYNVAASALLFSNPYNKALRVEVPDLGKEFSDSKFIGHDPEGTLYYNDLDSFDTSRKNVNYKVEKVDQGPGAAPLVNIKFYHQTVQECHAEFLAEDPTGSVTAMGMDGYTYHGSWSDLDICCGTAMIRKYDDETTITVTVGTIHKTATIKDTSGYLHGKSVDVKGNLYFKDLAKLGDGKYASWNDDRVVFYNNNMYSTDFTAYVRIFLKLSFIPFKYSTNDLGIKDADTSIFTSVSWA